MQLNKHENYRVCVNTTQLKLIYNKLVRNFLKEKNLDDPMQHHQGFVKVYFFKVTLTEYLTAADVLSLQTVEMK